MLPLRNTGLELIPLTLTAAKKYVNEVHRHHQAPQGGLFALAAARDGVIVGIAIIGRPVARHSDDGWSAEVTRLATDGSHNVCSFLYGASWRAAKERGYRRLITFTLKSESGISLRASGWKLAGDTPGRPWDQPSRPRKDKGNEAIPKWRWEVTTPNYIAGQSVPTVTEIKEVETA